MSICIHTCETPKHSISIDFFKYSEITLVLMCEPNLALTCIVMEQSLPSIHLFVVFKPPQINITFVFTGQSLDIWKISHTYLQ